MTPETRKAVLERLVAALDDPSGEVSPRSTRLSLTRYTDEAELDQELEALFRRRPVVVAHVSELCEVGDFVTRDLAGVPLVVVRGPKGVGVFINACRHRGARLVDEGRGCGKKALTCPYHAWTYDLSGTLLHVPGNELFVDLPKAELGLAAVSFEVRHGFVWVRLRGGESLAVEAFLGASIDEDFAAFELADHEVSSVSIRQCAANWKLVMDAFAEGYHLKSLHQKSLARFFLDLALVDDFEPHVRQVGARKSLREVADEVIDLRKHTTVFYNVFPNMVLVFHPHWVSMLTFFPEAVDRVRVEHRLLAPRTDDEGREQLAKSFAHIDGQVFEKEDLAIAQSIQSTLSSGASTEMLLGGSEEGMRLFHAARDAAIGD